MLTTVPALLAAPAALAPLALVTPTRSVLATAWLVLLLAVLAVGFTLRSAIDYGDRRARFASAVTHELRTPLTTFRMYSEMLADDIVTEPAQRRVYLETLKDESDRLSRLVENVLCYARLEEGRYHGRRERITVAELFDHVAGLLARRAASAGMRLSLTPADATVEVEREAIAQILFNLVDNACKYAGAAGGELTLAADVAGDRVRIALRDHGPGIPPEHHRRIFAPFERGVRATTDDVSQGVGLGLALARGLARDQGGDLTLDATATGGARFVLELATVPAVRQA
jgi:signal transduction histidine kinase